MRERRLSYRQVSSTPSCGHAPTLRLPPMPARFTPHFSRRRHLALQPVDRTGTQACKPGGLAYSSAPRELLAGSLHLVGFSTRATEIAADDARLAGELLPVRNLGLDRREPCLDALTDHRAVSRRQCLDTYIHLDDHVTTGRVRLRLWTSVVGCEALATRTI